MKKAYKRQVSLLLAVLPEISKEEDLALHGGTAINLFLRNMPRLSIDIDLTYIKIADRTTSYSDINKKLASIEGRVKKLQPGISTNHIQNDLKLLISNRGASIKVEVSQINRGCISTPETHILCEKAQEEFNSFCEISIVSHMQLYGGKIIAALDRQHPRDMFDIKHLMETDGITNEIKPGLLLCLLSSSRPVYELLNPNKKDQKKAYENQFAGMTDEAFSYVDYEKTRDKLIRDVNDLLNSEDKEFILGFKKMEPNWSVLDLKDFPAVKWKMKNLKKFSEENEDAYYETIKRLEEFFDCKHSA